IPFTIDWFDLPDVQRMLKGLLQYQFKSISSSVLSLLYGPTFTSIHDYWKKNCLMTQQSHRWAYTPRKPELKETRVPQCSSQHCL
ncbi:hypothetical protein ABTM26_19290, partial [Acinetobacter baumannii]